MIVKGKSSESTAKAHERERGECLTNLLAVDAINLHQQRYLSSKCSRGNAELGNGTWTDIIGNFISVPNINS